ncbi:MAG: glycosyltransferase [Bacteroidales bacterium]|jgi:hypothetical protein|nr:glycosyltransferase [Bacteroidales bacterium]MCI2136051.1 glycosyltransferase [Bacteroidales bacterium]
MLKPLVILFGYKEVHNASAQIARTFWENIPKTDYSPTIICAQMSSEVLLNNPVYHVNNNRLIHSIFAVFRRLHFKDVSMIPDIEYYSWNPQALKKIKKLLKSEHFDYIHTISSPQSTHLLGLELKRITGLPLVVQCNDPWHDTSGRKYHFKRLAELDLKYEREVAEGADIIIHTNRVIADIWHERYGEEVFNKIHVVPLSFNIYNLPVVQKKENPNEKLIISHIGNIYSSRSSMTIIRGVEKFLSDYPNYKSKFEIQFVGGVHQKEKEYVYEHGLTEYIKYLGKIAPENLQTIYEQSDIFLLIDVIIKRNPNYPSKLMMYYYYQRPILGLTTPNSNLEEELLESGHTVCYYDDIESVCDYLKIALTDYKRLNCFKTNYWEKHTVENVFSIYDAIIRENIIKN